MNIIDFFCGCGGASCGLEHSDHARVVAAVNHDPRAISWHAKNHPDVKHYNADVRDLDPQLLLKNHPKVDGFWWSAECTHLSVAKGGQPRDADSRMLNFELPRYARVLMPSYIFIENVPEFISWGPLKNGRADPERKGELHRLWVRSMERLGYRYEYRILTAADYGAYTTRPRYYGIFALEDAPIRWPEATHTNPKSAPSLMNSAAQPWRQVRDVLDLDNHGTSIFDRPKPLVQATLRRIAYGINKFAPEAEREPLQYLIKYYGSGSGAKPLDAPLDTITTKDRFALVTAQWLDKQYGSGQHNIQGIDGPVHTLTAIPKFRLVTTQFIKKYYGGDNHCRPLGEPLATITTVPHEALVTAGVRFDGLRDIKMRMLTVAELRAAQGFPDSYRLPKSQTLAKKFIGNSVVPVMAEALVRAQVSEASGWTVPVETRLSATELAA